MCAIVLTMLYKTLISKEQCMDYISRLHHPVHARKYKFSACNILFIITPTATMKHHEKTFLKY